jgi:predicted alpha/beta superfamily hydrolase
MNNPLFASIPLLHVFPLKDHKGHIRTIRVLLPSAYFLDSNRSYPVIYLQDGQNLFGNGSGFGSWHLETPLLKSAAAYRDKVIIVGIDHSGVNRVNEFSAHKGMNDLEGTPFDYLFFITHVLKPYIDHTYRTLSDRIHTSIGGSSLGAMISLYSILFYPQYFSKLLLFSPSLWIAPRFLYDVNRLNTSLDFRIYIYAGAKESRFMLHHAGQLGAALKAFPNVEVQVAFRKNGRHREYDWGKHFGIAAKYLFTH